MREPEDREKEHGLDRREFLRLSAVAAAELALTGCGSRNGDPIEVPPIGVKTKEEKETETDNGRSIMNTLIIYDTKHGNTAEVARTMGDATGAEVRPITDVSADALKDFDMLIVGSPTHGGQMTQPISDLFVPSLSLEGIKVAAFDTRTDVFMNKLLPWGYAAPKIAKRLTGRGGTLLIEPEGFIVLGMEGPLKEGELARAAAWAEKLTA